MKLWFESKIFLLCLFFSFTLPTLINELVTRDGSGEVHLRKRAIWLCLPDEAEKERERNEERERVQFENIFSHSNVVKLGSVPDGI